jgi:uroporphyrinogen decarboxylase
MRGFGDAMVDLMLNRKLSDAIMEKVLEISAGIAVTALKEVGDIIDVVCVPEDMGTQQQLFMRPDMYREVIKPYHRRMFEAIKNNTNAKVAIHSDGAISDILGDYIDIGIEALNPVQVSAAGMGDTKKLKREFGKHLTFWGAVDTHHVLPFGTPKDVAEEVRLRIDELGKDGGYVLGSVHTINSEVPSANVAAMLETARGYYPWEG